MYLPKDDSLPVILKSRDYEVFTVVPVKSLKNGTRFAPIGLLKMFNSGGAVKGFDTESETVRLKLRGCGSFGAYSSHRPKRVTVDSNEAEFVYEQSSGLVTVVLSVPEEELYLWNITVEL